MWKYGDFFTVWRFPSPPLLLLKTQLRHFHRRSAGTSLLSVSLGHMRPCHQTSTLILTNGNAPSSEAQLAFALVYSVTPSRLIQTLLEMRERMFTDSNIYTHFGATARRRKEIHTLATGIYHILTVGSHQNQALISIQARHIWGTERNV